MKSLASRFSPRLRVSAVKNVLLEALGFIRRQRFQNGGLCDEKLGLSFFSATPRFRGEKCFA
jgi:hypothetical protein